MALADPYTIWNRVLRFDPEDSRNPYKDFSKGKGLGSRPTDPTS
jgi:hypothetical protein